MPWFSHASAPPGAGVRAVDAQVPAFMAEAAVSPSTYAVPRFVLWIGDAVVESLGLVAAWCLIPVIHPWLAEETAGRVLGLGWLGFPRSSPVVGLPLLGQITWFLLITIPVTLLVVEVLGGYRRLLEQTRLRLVAVCALGPLVALSFVSLALVAVKNQDISRALIFSWALLSAVGLLAYRSVLRAYKRSRLRAGHYSRNVVIVASAGARQDLVRHFAERISPNLRRLQGYLDTPAAAAVGEEGVPEGAPAGSVDLPCLGSVADLGRLLVHRPIHEVIAVEGADSAGWMRSVLDDCDFFHVTVHVVPQALLLLPSADSQLTWSRGSLGLPEIELRPRYFDQDALVVKRLFDILVSATLLGLLSPLFLLIALLIKVTTPGLSVFYPWRVIGYKGRPFTGYKFTTMVADADERKDELMHLNEMSGPVFKIKDDPRVTRVGRWLRKYSLNELPQLWSVLRGDMSLVGPRPAYPTELARYELWHKRKLCVQPGITCLWQVRGRNRISSFDEWVRMDFEYIDNWSFWLDCRILLRTAWGVVAGTGW